MPMGTDPDNTSYRTASIIVKNCKLTLEMHNLVETRKEHDT